MSDQQCIEFSIQERSHPVNAGRGGKVRSPSWNTKRLSKDKLRGHLEETRLMDELGWARSAGSLEDTVRTARRKVFAAWKKAKIALRQGIKKSRLQCWKEVIGEVEKDPRGLALKLVTKRLVTRRNTPGLDNADRVKYIVRSLFPHVGPSQRQDRSSCVVRREELFTLEQLKRAGGRIKANTATGIDWVPNEIVKEVIEAYSEILSEAFNFCFREGKFFVDWKKQRLVLLREGNKPLEDASSYRPICLLDTMGKLLEEMILQSLQGHMVGEIGLSETQFGFRRGRSTVDAIQAVVNIATNARRGTGKRKGFCALISIDIRNAFNAAR